MKLNPFLDEYLNAFTVEQRIFIQEYFKSLIDENPLHERIKMRKNDILKAVRDKYKLKQFEEKPAY